MFSCPKILFLVSLLFVALLNSIPTYLLNFEFFYRSFQLTSVDITFIIPVHNGVLVAAYGSWYCKLLSKLSDDVSSVS